MGFEVGLDDERATRQRTQFPVRSRHGGVRASRFGALRPARRL